MSKIKPTSDHIFVEPIEEELFVTGGILIPATVSKEKPMKGEVVAVGPGKFDDGVRIPMEVKVGDIVLFSKYGPTEVKVDGKEVLILSESDIYAILN